MTTVDTPSEPSEPIVLEAMDDGRLGDPAQPLRRRRRRPAPKSNPFWRFVFPLIVIAAGAAVVLLWRHGTKVVLDSTDGELVDIVTDPTEPGFEAFVDPTPTMLLVHVEEAELVGVTVMAQTLLENGGKMVLLSADLLIDNDTVAGVEPILLRDAYDQGGLELLEALVGEMFGFGFLETAELTTDDLGGWMSLVEPIPFGLIDDLRQSTGEGQTEIWLSRGQKELDGSVAAQVYAFSSPNRPDSDRNERQVDLWTGWFAEIARADDLVAATLPFENGLSPYLRALGDGSVDVSLLPADPVPFGEQQPFYSMNETQRTWLAETARGMTPLPIAPLGANVSSVRLLSGTEDPGLRDEALELLVDLGLEVAVVGNASEFGATTTTVTYHRLADAGVAEDLAAAIGASVGLVEDLEQPVDLTVVIGSDWENP